MNVPVRAMPRNKRQIAVTNNSFILAVNLVINVCHYDFENWHQCGGRMANRERERKRDGTARGRIIDMVDLVLRIGYCGFNL